MCEAGVEDFSAYFALRISHFPLSAWPLHRLPDQLGLKVDAHRATVPAMVIDRIEPLTLAKLSTISAG